MATLKRVEENLRLNCLLMQENLAEASKTLPRRENPVNTNNISSKKTTSDSFCINKSKYWFLYNNTTTVFSFLPADVGCGAAVSLSKGRQSFHKCWISSSNASLWKQLNWVLAHQLLDHKLLGCFRKDGEVGLINLYINLGAGWRNSSVSGRHPPC